MAEEKIWEEGACVMWQKYKGKYHLILHHQIDKEDGRFIAIACDDLINSRRKNQTAYPLDIRTCCETCACVWRLVYTSTSDAKNNIKDMSNLRALRRALYLSRSVTLNKMIDKRIRKIEKDAEKERKLRLIQKAYD